MGRAINLRERLSSAPVNTNATVRRSRNSVSESMASALASGVYTSVGPPVNERQSSGPEETSVVRKSSTSRSNTSLDKLKTCDCFYGAAMTCSCNLPSDSPVSYDSCDMLAFASQQSSPVQEKSPFGARKSSQTGPLTNLLSPTPGDASTTVSTGWVASSFGATAISGNSAGVTAANWWRTDTCGTPEISSSTESLMVNTPTTASIGEEALIFLSDSDSEAYFSTAPTGTASFTTALDDPSVVWPSPTGQPEFKKCNISLIDKTISDHHTASTLAGSEGQDGSKTSENISNQSDSSDINKIKKSGKDVGESENVSFVGDDDTGRSSDDRPTDVENLASKFDAINVNSRESELKRESQCIDSTETKSELALQTDESKAAGTSLQETNVGTSTQEERLPTGDLDFPIGSDIKNVTEPSPFFMTDNSAIFGGGVGIDRGSSDKFCGIGARYRKVKERPTIVVQYSIKELRTSFNEISSFINELSSEYPGPEPLQNELLKCLTGVIFEFTCSRLKLEQLTKSHDFVTSTWQRREPLDDPKASLIIMKDVKRKWRETLKNKKPSLSTRGISNSTEQTPESRSASNYETTSNADLLSDDNEFSLVINHLIAVVFFWKKRLGKRLELIQTQIRNKDLELDELKIFLADKDFTLDSMEKEPITAPTDAELLTIDNSVNSARDENDQLDTSYLRSFIETVIRTNLNLDLLK